MKIKGDFVTNSSSTSFIVKVSTENDDVIRLVERLNAFLDDYSHKNDWREEFIQPLRITADMIKKTSDGAFQITDYLPLHEEGEMPDYWQELMETVARERRILDLPVNKVEIRVRDLNKEATDHERDD